MNKFICKCNVCGGATSKAYARLHQGKCKPCVTGVERDTRPDWQKAGFQDRGEYTMSEEYKHEVLGHNDLSPDF